MTQPINLTPQTGPAEEHPSWSDIGRYCHYLPVHVLALSDLAVQAGRDAYAADVDAGRELLPPPSPYLDRRIYPPEDIRMVPGKAWAGLLLAQYPTKFGGHFPLRAIADWWLLGYDQARSESDNAETSAEDCTARATGSRVDDQEHTAK